MKGWVKIISLENHDVCVTREFDSEEEEESVIVSFMTDICKVNQTLGFEGDGEKADRFFNSVDEKVCQMLLDDILALFEDAE